MAKKEAAVEEVQDYSKNARTVSALADARWEMGKTYTQTVTPRKGPNAGEVLTCKMKVGRKGFTDHNGKLWPSPTALTTAFAREECGQSDEARRPASHFFGIEVPKASKRDTRGSGGTEAKAPKKEAKVKAAKATKAPKKEVKVKAAKAGKAPKKEAKVNLKVLKGNGGLDPEDIPETDDDALPEIPEDIPPF